MSIGFRQIVGILRKVSAEVGYALVPHQREASWLSLGFS